VSRDLPTELVTAIDEAVVRPFLAVRIELPDPVYAFTGRGLLTFEDADGNSRDWIGAGDVAAFDSVGESTDGSATGVKVALYKVPAEFREDIAQQAVRGATFEIYVGALNEDYQTVVATKLIWKGRLDTYTVTDGGDTLTVEVTAESRAIDQRRPAIKRFTDEWQQRNYPGDKFFEFVPQMTEISILWADAELGASGVGIGGGGGLPSSYGNGGFLLGGQAKY
jgi:hypothetical protein